MAAEATDIPGWVGIAGVSPVIAAALYKFWRMLKSDSVSDTATSQQSGFTDTLLKRIEVLEKRVDTMAQERNEARERAAALEVERNKLQEALDKKEVERAAAIARLSKEIETIKADHLARCGTCKPIMGM